jgi:hypothetical protein
LESKYNLQEMLVDALRLFSTPKFLSAALHAINKILELEQDQQMIDISIQDIFLKYGLYEELTKLLENPDATVNHLAGDMIDNVIDEHNNNYNNI